MKNIVYLITKFLFTFDAIYSASLIVFFCLIYIKFLSDKNMNLIKTKKKFETENDKDILGMK